MRACSSADLYGYVKKDDPEIRAHTTNIAFGNVQFLCEYDL